MLLTTRDPRPADDPPSNISISPYRRTSIPSIAAIPSLPFPTTISSHRPPLAPLHPQLTPKSFLDDHQMSSTSHSTTSHLDYPLQDTHKDSDRSQDLSRYTLGKPIATNRATDDDSLVTPSLTSLSIRRRSIPGLSARALPYPPSRPVQRRPSNTPSASGSTSRRPSIPTSQSHHAPAMFVANVPDVPPLPPTILPNPGEDLYSGLSSFTFGAAHLSPPTHIVDTSDLISPLTRLGTASADRTPRPSVSGPSTGSNKPYNGKSRINGKQKATDAADAEMGDDEYEDEDDAARQKSRSKMRAIDDGSRRPSLPTNVYIPDPSSSSSSASLPPPPSSTSTTAPKSRLQSPSSNSETDDSEADPDDQGDLDTDVEFDLHPNTSVEVDVSDTASQHTFGGGFDHYAFGSGNLSRRSERMSANVNGNEEEDEDSDGRDASVSPVTFSRQDYDSEGPEVDTFLVGSDSSNRSLPRRGSLPWPIPGASPPWDSSSGTPRDREDSMVTIIARKASRSMDDDINMALVDPANQSSSQPETRADFRALEAQHAQQDSNDCGATEVVEEITSDVYDGINVDYILGADSRQSWSSGVPSYVQRDQPRRPIDGRAAAAGTEGWAWGSPPSSIMDGRRPSTITVGASSGEDMFALHLKQYDRRYNTRRLEWSFKKESVDGRGLRPTQSPTQPMPTRHHGAAGGELEVKKTMMPGTQELWIQAHVGRFKVDRLLIKPDQPEKASQHRIHVRHIPDPFSKGNTQGGPSSVIHKHSRAVAFSIFRTHTLFTPATRRTTTHMNTSISILLATKKVQEQYTSTRTTSKLNSHGLLEDRPRRIDEGSTAYSSSATAVIQGGGSSRPSSAHGLQDDRHDKDSKRKGKSRMSHLEDQDGNSSSAASGIGRSSQTTSGSSVHSGVDSTTTGTSPSRSPGSSTPASPIVRNASSHSISVAPQASHTTEVIRPSAEVRTMASMDAPTSAIGVVSFTSDAALIRMKSARSAGTTIEEEDTMDLDDDEQSPPRTSHAEAFATIDSQYMEYVRGRSDQRPQDHDSSSHSLVNAFRRKIFGQSTSKGASRLPVAGPSAAPLEGHYTPPWLTMAPRSAQEERERVIQTLNESFKDVGLLPSYRPQKNQGRAKRKKIITNANIFANVPADSLYMLLPLWPGETDQATADKHEDPAAYIVPIEERQYLLVYYIAFTGEEEDRKKSVKKRTRAQTQTPSTSAHHSVNVSLQTFRVCARLVNYSDLRETGVRLPDYGLSVTGSMIEATQFLPPSSIREQALDDIVIGVCSTRNSGMEFIPEGLVKLGLCMPSDLPTPLPEREEDEVPEMDYELTPIGRAAIEMAWLGCMAVTCFGAT